MGAVTGGAAQYPRTPGARPHRRSILIRFKIKNFSDLSAQQGKQQRSGVQQLWHAAVAACG
jgi:hypothetical protein